MDMHTPIWFGVGAVFGAGCAFVGVCLMIWAIGRDQQKWQDKWDGERGTDAGWKAK